MNASFLIQSQNSCLVTNKYYLPFCSPALGCLVVQLTLSSNNYGYVPNKYFTRVPFPTPEHPLNINGQYRLSLFSYFFFMSLIYTLWLYYCIDNYLQNQISNLQFGNKRNWMKEVQPSFRLRECFKGERTFLRPPNPPSQKQKEAFLKFNYFNQVVNSFSHHFLYCLDRNKTLTVSQERILNSQRHKYIGFITKNFKYKIPEQFTDKKILKEKKKLLLAKIKTDLQKKKQMEYIHSVSKKKRITKQQKTVELKGKKREKDQNKQSKKKTVAKSLKQKEKTGKNGQNINEEGVDINQEQHQSIQPESNHFESEENLENDELDELEEEQM